MTFDLPIASLFQFLFVLARLGGVVMVAPGFGAGTVPTRLRVLLALTLALLISPLQATTLPALPRHFAELVWLTGNELGVGLILGFGVNLIFTAAQMAGQLIGQMSGLQAADVFNPTLGAAVPLFAQLIDMMLVVIFLLVGGHHLVLSALMDTFRAMPVTHVQWETGALEVLVRLLAESFVLGLKIGAPVTATMLVSLLVLGLISRAMPQLNLMQIGFGLNSLLTLAVLGMTLGSTVVLFDEELFRSIDRVRDGLLAAVSDAAIEKQPTAEGFEVSPAGISEVR